MPRPSNGAPGSPSPQGRTPSKRALGFFVVTPLDQSGSSFCSSERSQGRHKEVLCSLHDVKHGSAIRSSCRRPGVVGT